ncbi:helix-turn-helix domain-containing protein [Lacrimispora brassicae]
MKMTIQQLMQYMKMSRYRLSKISGIPWATLADIYSGKTHLNWCGAGMISRLSKAIGPSIEELLELESEPAESASDGSPNRKTYLGT